MKPEFFTEQIDLPSGATAEIVEATVEKPSHVVEGGATYGVVLSGEVQLHRGSGPTSRLDKGMWFAAGERITLAGGKLLVINTPECERPPFFSVGGPVEETGRLKYIDGCTDSLLVSPVKKGESCLNLLHFPPGIEQTAHTHPSERCGVILSGKGICRTPEGNWPLVPGMGWMLPPDWVHSFHTDDSDLLLVAWHPDSDFGPEDHCHPMLNRTIVDGVSASNLPEIQTK